MSAEPTMPRAAYDDHAPDRGTGTLGVRARESMNAWWRDRSACQTLLYATAALLLVSGVFHTVLWAVSGDPWTGAVSWRKPALFGISFGLTGLSIAWIHTFLRPRRMLGWVVCGSFAIASLGEVTLITLQRWRGVASHFNSATSFDASVFIGMGLLVAVAALGLLVVTVRSFGTMSGDPATAVAIRVGLLLLMAGQVLGELILNNGGQVLTSNPGVDLAAANIFGAAGQMKVPHAVALHGVQVLPLLAWGLSLTDANSRVRMRLVWVAAAGYTGLVVVSALQTFRGSPPLQLDLAASALLLLSIALLAGAWVALGALLARPNRGAGPSDAVTTSLRSGTAGR
jgi:hypothetical protein